MLVKHYLRTSKRKNLKYEKMGAVKKTKVSAVKNKIIRRNNGPYYVFRLESNDEIGNVYYSEEFENAEHGGRALDDMMRNYDGVIYNLGDKDVVIKQVNDNIRRLETELSNDPGFFKKLKLKWDLKVMKDYIKIANEGPITPYLICNGHKVSVGDSIDVYVNPDNPEEYYFDLDFTQQQ